MVQAADGVESAAAKAALPRAPDGAGDGPPLLGLWSAWIVALVAAFVAWVWYGRGGGEEEGAKGASGSGTPEPLQANDVSSPREPVENQAATPRECSTPDVPKAQLLLKEQAVPSMNYKGYARNEASGYPATASEEQPPNQKAVARGVATSAEGTLNDKPLDWCQEQRQCLSSVVDHRAWELVPPQSSWGDASRNSGVDDVGSKDLDLAKRVVAVSPMPQAVHMTFRVHYITHSEAQLIAVTGDHECLGQWHHFVPLRCDKNGFWSDSVALPVDTKVEWKFVVVENGKIRRWEECENRTLVTEHEDRVAHKWWGYP